MIKNLKELNNTVGVLKAMRLRQNIFFCTREEYDNLISEVSDKYKNREVYGIMNEQESEKWRITVFGTLLYQEINFIFIELLN